MPGCACVGVLVSKHDLRAGPDPKSALGTHHEVTIVLVPFFPLRISWWRVKMA